MLKSIIFLTTIGQCIVSGLKDVPEPTINPNFMCSTVEVDSTNTTIVEQRLVFDVDLRRSLMYAEGSLVKGGMQQIKRCDLMPATGWYSNAGGSQADKPSTWSCENDTIPVYAELPRYCQYNNFWDFPAMKYVGEDEMTNGKTCDRWEYHSGTDTFAFWAIGDIPCATGRVKSATSSLYTIFFTDFIAGNPPVKAYNSIDGLTCPDATPMTDGYINKNNEIPDNLTLLGLLNNRNKLASSIKNDICPIIGDVVNPSPGPDPESPTIFKVQFDTNVMIDGVQADPIIVEVVRKWAPLGVDHFYSLIKDGFYNGAAFFRVVPDFVVQYGISSDPLETSKWNSTIVDDPVLAKNIQWSITYATAGANTRTTQLFINYADNSESLDAQGFAPFGMVKSGFNTALAINNPTPGDSNGISQFEYTKLGNDWLTKKYPDVSLITCATLL
jgi:cyclophilin family peptidyl-prolyl cis-trans isomerase